MDLIFDFVLKIIFLGEPCKDNTRCFTLCLPQVTWYQNRWALRLRTHPWAEIPVGRKVQIGPFSSLCMPNLDQPFRIRQYTT